MSFISKHKLVFLTTGYFVFLLYILAALLWWFIALNKQNNAMINLELSLLKKDDPSYIAKHNAIMFEQRRKIAQYVGEGVIFFCVNTGRRCYCLSCHQKTIAFIPAAE